MKGLSFMQVYFASIPFFDRLNSTPVSVFLRMTQKMNRSNYVYMNYKIISKLMPISESAFYRALDALIEAQMVEKKGKGLYKINWEFARYGAAKEDQPWQVIDNETGEVKRVNVKSKRRK